MEGYHGVEWREDFFDDLENELWIDQHEVLEECFVDQEDRMRRLEETPAQDPTIIRRFAATSTYSADAKTRRDFLKVEDKVWNLDSGEYETDEDGDPPKGEN